MDAITTTPRTRAAGIDMTRIAGRFMAWAHVRAAVLRKAKAGRQLISADVLPSPAHGCAAEGGPWDIARLPDRIAGNMRNIDEDMEGSSSEAGGSEPG